MSAAPAAPENNMAAATMASPDFMTILSRDRVLFVRRRARRLAPFLFQTALDADLGPIDVLFPRSGVDKGIGLAGLAILEFRGALENGAVGIIGSGIPAMVGEVDVDALDLGDAGRALHRILEAFDAVAAAKSAGVERLVGNAVVVDRELGRHHARRVTRGLVKFQRRVAQSQQLAVGDDAIAFGRARSRR